ncbi:MAG: hypothetical protein ACJA2W_000364 [Planctomycetota bacterium]|jgi:hypothetical protein
MHNELTSPEVPPAGPRVVGQKALGVAVGVHAAEAARELLARALRAGASSKPWTNSFSPIWWPSL